MKLYEIHVAGENVYFDPMPEIEALRLANALNREILAEGIKFGKGHIPELCIATIEEDSK